MNLLNRKLFFLLLVPVFGACVLLFILMIKDLKKLIPHSTWGLAMFLYGISLIVFLSVFAVIFAVLPTVCEFDIPEKFAGIAMFICGGYCSNAMFIPIYRKIILPKYEKSQLPAQPNDDGIK